LECDEFVWLKHSENKKTRGGESLLKRVREKFPSGSESVCILF